MSHVGPRSFVIAAAASLLSVIAPPVVGQTAPSTASARLVSPEGELVGFARLRETPRAGVLLRVEFAGLPPGTHALHIHETGRCEAPSFGSAGGHYSPGDRAHGLLHPDGPHAGDLPNIHVPASGEVVVERVTDRVSLDPDARATLFDQDGSALVIHAGADDYESQPAGDAGERIACGVIRR